MFLVRSNKQSKRNYELSVRRTCALPESTSNALQILTGWSLISTIAKYSENEPHIEDKCGYHTRGDGERDESRHSWGKRGILFLFHHAPASLSQMYIHTFSCRHVRRRWGRSIGGDRRLRGLLPPQKQETGGSAGPQSRVGAPSRQPHYVTWRYVTLRYVTLRTIRYVTIRYDTLRYDDYLEERHTTRGRHHEDRAADIRHRRRNRGYRYE